MLFPICVRKSSTSWINILLNTWLLWPFLFVVYPVSRSVLHFTIRLCYNRHRVDYFDPKEVVRSWCNLPGSCHLYIKVYFSMMVVNQKKIRDDQFTSRYSPDIHLNHGILNLVRVSMNSDKHTGEWGGKRGFPEFNKYLSNIFQLIKVPKSFRPQVLCRTVSIPSRDSPIVRLVDR